MDIIGIDSGSTATKGILWRDGIEKTAILPTAGDPKGAMEKIIEILAPQPGHKIVTTGYGRNIIESHKSVTEITCHAKGALYLYPGAGTVIDIGGQDSKVIKLDENGMVTDFIMNDKCAAGTGRFVEVIIKTLGERIEALDDFVKDASVVHINSMCTVFAESEVISLTAKGESRENVMLGIIHSIAERTANQYRKVRPEGNVIFTGGLSKSRVFTRVLSHYAQAEIYTHKLSQFAGAVGAAQIGKTL